MSKLAHSNEETMDAIERQPLPNESKITVLPPPVKIAVYNEFRSQLAELKQTNSITTFDYESKKGNADARSYIYKLRQTKAAVGEARKKEKAASLEYGRKVDDEAKEITAEIEKMIEVHQKVIDQIEERETKRIESIKKRMADIAAYQECIGHDSEETAHALAKLKTIVIDESFGEFQLDAMKELSAALRAQETQYASALRAEAEREENERLRREVEEYQRKEHEEKIRKEAEEKAKAEAEAKAKAAAEESDRKLAAEKQRAEDERLAGERRELELKLEKERAEKEKLAAEAREKAAKDQAESERLQSIERARIAKEEAAKREEQARIDAIAAEQLRVKQEQEKKAAEDAKREADEKHRNKINGEALTAIVAVLNTAISPTDQAQALIAAIGAGNIPHLKIMY